MIPAASAKVRMIGQATVTSPIVGRKVHERGAAPAACVVMPPEITAATLPEPVSAIALSVVGPSGLILASLVNVAVPLRPLETLIQLTVSGLS